MKYSLTVEPDDVHQTVAPVDLYTECEAVSGCFAELWSFVGNINVSVPENAPVT